MGRLPKANKKTAKKNAQVLLTSEQLAQIGGISRATILRLEESKLLIPVKRGGRGGARLYGVDAIDKLAKINTFKKLGFSPDQIAEFYNGPDDYGRLLEIMQKKLTFLSNVISSYKLKYNPQGNAELTEKNALPIVAYCCDYPLDEAAPSFCGNMVSTIHQVIQRGYSVQFDFDPLIILSPDKKSYSCCIPVFENCCGKNGVRRIPAYHAVCESKMSAPADILPELSRLENKARDAGYQAEGRCFVSFYTSPTDGEQEILAQLLRFGCEIA